jgi:hypothetical protein
VSLLADRLLEVHFALARAQLAHAFGGAIALAYCTEEPRGTRDLDVNVFVDPTRARAVLAALPAAVAISEKDVETARSEGQIRVWWEETPIDVFLDVHSFHEYIARDVRQVSFEGATIPVLDGTALTVFKALFDRTKDWADIEEIVAAGALEPERAVTWLRSMQGQDSPAARKLEAVIADAAEATAEAG